MATFTRSTLIAVLMGALSFEVYSQSTDDTVITTTTAPAIELIKFANYTQPCRTDFNLLPLPFYIFCNTYEGTVACVNKECKCNMGSDAEFNTEWNLCVGKVGSLCFLEASSIGRKVCVENADCFPDKGTNAKVGTCQCLYGFEDDSAGSCRVDNSIPDPERSTIRPTTTKKPMVPITSTESTVSTVSQSTTPRGNAGRNLASSGVYVISGLYVLSKF